MNTTSLQSLLPSQSSFKYSFTVTVPPTVVPRPLLLQPIPLAKSEQNVGQTKVQASDN